VQPNGKRVFVGFQPGQSGNPAGGRLLKDQAEALYRTMIADLRPQTPTDEILLKQASLMLAKAARFTTRKDADAAVRLVSEARRTIATLRRHTPKSGEQDSLAGYLASRYGNPDERPGDEQTPEASEAAETALERAEDISATGVAMADGERTSGRRSRSGRHRKGGADS
jgi:hypothetical protein